jgi:type II secretory pathway component PulM
MNKLQRLQRVLIREGVMLAGVVFLLVIILFAVNYIQQGVLESRTEAESLLNQDRAQLALMQSQLAKASEATRRFDALNLEEQDQYFANNTEVFKESLRSLKTKFRLGNGMRLIIAGAQVSQQADLQALNYKVLVREDMELVISAMSDVHAYSFLKQWLKEAPGIIRVNGLKLNRRAPMSIESLAQMKNGAVPELVGGVIRFTWITLENKTAPAEPAAPASPPPLSAQIPEER